MENLGNSSEIEKLRGLDKNKLLYIKAGLLGYNGTSMRTSASRSHELGLSTLYNKILDYTNSFLADRLIDALKTVVLSYETNNKLPPPKIQPFFTLKDNVFGETNLVHILGHEISYAMSDKGSGPYYELTEQLKKLRSLQYGSLPEKERHDKLKEVLTALEGIVLPKTTEKQFVELADLLDFSPSALAMGHVFSALSSKLTDMRLENERFSTKDENLNAMKEKLLDGQKYLKDLFDNIATEALISKNATFKQEFYRECRKINTLANDFIEQSVDSLYMKDVTYESNYILQKSFSREENEG